MKPEPVTAATITDDQIRWLRLRTGWRGEAARDQEVIDRALHGFDGVSRRQARARCADMFNKRAGEVSYEV